MHACAHAQTISMQECCCKAQARRPSRFTAGNPLAIAQAIRCTEACVLGVRGATQPRLRNAVTMPMPPTAHMVLYGAGNLTTTWGLCSPWPEITC